MKKSLCLIALFVFGLNVIIMSGCSNNVQSSVQPRSSEISPSVILENPSIEPIQPSVEIKPTLNISLYDSSKNQLSAYITDRMFEENKDNVLFSPLSLDVAIGMVANAAEGQTKDELDTFLKTEHYNLFIEGYNEYIKNNFNTNEFNGYYNTKFQLANAIWLDYGLNINNQTNKLYEHYFDAEIKNVPMTNNPQKATDTINQWCKEKTYKLINKIVNIDDISGKPAVITNSLYFEAPWRDNWNECNNTFTNDDNTISSIPLMASEADIYYENDKATAFGKKYANGLCFIGILPKCEGSFSIQALDIDSLLESKDSNTYTVYAQMPSELNYDSGSSKLVDILKEIGMNMPFDKQNAQITQLTEENLTLNIDKIIQKTRIELDKNGTKAAAITAIIMDKNSAMISNQNEKRIYLNRPFAYLIYDEVNNQIVFMGKVTHLD